MYGGIDDPSIEARIKRTGRWPWIDVIERRTPDSQLRYMDGCYLYAGLLYNHYGHIMTESIHRLWAYDPSIHSGVVFVVLYHDGYEGRLGQFNYPKYLADILKIFGIGEEKIILVKQGMIFEEMDLVVPGSFLGGGAEEWYFPILEEVYERVESLSNIDLIKPDRLFMGRSHIIHKGTLLGESYFGHILQKNKYIYFKPEEYNIYDQITIVKKSKEVVFVEGSAIYGVDLVSKVDGVVSMIPRRSTNSLYVPHLECKCNFSTIGDLSSIIRLNTSGGKSAPKSPVITASPKNMYDDLLRRVPDLNEVFDYKVFSDFQDHDILAYGAGNNEYIMYLRDSVLRDQLLK